MKLLILRFSSIGDIVLTTPVIRCLKKQLPGAEIHYVCKKYFSTVLEHNPYIDRLICFEKDVSEIIPELKNDHYDYIIDLHHNIRTLKIKSALKSKSFSFDKLNVQKWVLVNLKINLLPKIHIVDRYMDSVSSLGVTNDGKGLDYFISPADEDFIQTLPVSFGSYIAWAIGATHATKQLPLDKMISIGKKIKSPLILLGGKEDMQKGALLKNALGENVIDLCGKSTLNQSAAVIKHAKKVITHDTGLMHIAVAFKKEIISVWGNTIPEFGMYPYLPGEENKNILLEVRGLYCRPCTKIGFDKCPKGHFKCMRDIVETKFVGL